MKKVILTIYVNWTSKKKRVSFQKFILFASMAKGARSKRVKRNNTAKRERLAKFENRKLEIISKKLNELIYGDQDDMSMSFYFLFFIIIYCIFIYN